MLPENLLIEEAREEDIDAIAALEAISFKDPWPKESFINEFHNNSLAYYLVARYEGVLIGYIGLWLIIDEIHITTLAVDKDYQRQGIGSALVKAALNMMIKQGAELATLEVRPSNTAARLLYQKLGFTLCGLRCAYYKDEDALLMNCRLRDNETADE